MTAPRPAPNRRVRIDATTAARLRADMDAAVVPVARRYGVSVGYCLRIAQLGGSAQV